MAKARNAKATDPKDQDDITYKIIRQPYRITMAKWDYTAVQKRILTKIISKLQKEISLIEKGVPFGQLDLFSENGESVEVIIPLNELVKNANNYTHVKNALQGLRKIDVEIVLPSTKSKKSNQPEDETILTGLIERAVMKKNARTVKIVMHTATAKELVKTTNGLTSFAENVMFLTDNSYTQKIYEMLSHWKDKEVFWLTPEDFRKRLSLESKYPQMRDLVKRVIKPAEQELKEIGDIYFEFSTTKLGTKIVKFNFIIKHRKTIYEQELQHIKLREDTVNLLRMNFKLKDEHIQSIDKLLNDPKTIQPLRMKLMELYTLLNQRKDTTDKIMNVPAWIVKSLLNEFQETH